MDRRELIRLWMAWKSDRDGKQYTFKQLASDAGLNPNYLSNVMTGIRNPGVKTLNKIVAALGISLAEFFTGPHAGVGSHAKTSGDNYENAVSSIEQTPDSSHDMSPGVSDEKIPSSMIAGAIDPRAEADDAAEVTKADGQPEDKDTDTGEDRVKTEKFGLKISENGGKGFDMLFSTYGFESSDFETVDLEVPATRIRPGNMRHTGDVSRDNTSADDTTDMRARQTAGTSVRPSPDDGNEPSVPLLEKDFDGDIREWMENFRSGGDGYRSVRRSLTVDGPRVAVFRMDDDSMFPDIGEGDILYIDLDRKFTNTDGGIGIVRIGGKFKARRIFERGDTFQLVPVNPRYSPDAAPVENTTVLKIVLWLPQSEDKF